LTIDKRNERTVRTKALFREVNERLRDLSVSLGDGRLDSCELLCECGDDHCFAKLKVSAAEYERVRSDGTQFVVKPGHELLDVDEVVSRANGYWIVRKRTEAAEIAEQHDPRA
jgi:hypothetical protein